MAEYDGGLMNQVKEAGGSSKVGRIWLGGTGNWATQEGGSGPSSQYRMRGYDTTLAQTVYWTATIVDSAAAQYSGPGPVNDIVVSKIIKP